MYGLPASNTSAWLTFIPGYGGFVPKLGDVFHELGVRWNDFCGFVERGEGGAAGLPVVEGGSRAGVAVQLMPQSLGGGRWGAAHTHLFAEYVGGAEREVSLQRLRLAAGKDKNLYCCTYCKILKISRKCVLFLLQSKIVTKFLSSIPPTVARIVLSFALLHMTIISNDIRAQ